MTIFEDISKSMNKKIQVCFISHFAYSLFNNVCKVAHGGAELDLYLIAKELSNDENYEISFLVGDFGQKDEERYENIRVKKLVRKSKSKLSIVKKIRGQE